MFTRAYICFMFMIFIKIFFFYILFYTLVKSFIYHLSIAGLEPILVDPGQDTNSSQDDTNIRGDLD